MRGSQLSCTGGKKGSGEGSKSFVKQCSAVQLEELRDHNMALHLEAVQARQLLATRTEAFLRNQAELELHAGTVDAQAGTVPGANFSCGDVNNTHLTTCWYDELEYLEYRWRKLL